jgi:hypothetical protein
VCVCYRLGGDGVTKLRPSGRQEVLMTGTVELSLRSLTTLAHGRYFYVASYNIYLISVYIGIYRTCVCIWHNLHYSKSALFSFFLRSSFFCFIFFFFLTYLWYVSFHDYIYMYIRVLVLVN